MFTTLDLTYENISGCDVLNNELNNVWKWLSVNKLSLNIDKTHFMIFHSRMARRKPFIPDLFINGIKIKHTTTFKFLGIIFDENLTWKQHCDYIARKINKVCGIMNRLKRILPYHTMRTLYFSMIHSHLNYGLLAWGFQPNRLFKIQKRAIRTITLSKYNAHTEPLFKSSGILKLNDLLNLISIKFYYKLKNEQLPQYFNSFTIEHQNSIHEYPTRQGSLIRTNPTRTIFAQKCLHNALPSILNSAPTELYNRIYTHSLPSVAQLIKRDF